MGILRPHFHGLRGIVQQIAVRSFNLFDHQRVGVQIGDDDLPLIVGRVNSVRGQLAARVGDKLSVRRHNLERRAFQRSFRELVAFGNDKRSLRAVVDR